MPARRIIIEGELARIVETTVIAEAPLSSLSQYLETYKPVVLPILPDHTCHIAYDANTKVGVLVVQIPPFRTGMTIHFSQREHRVSVEDYARKSNARALFNVQLPWTYLVYDFRLDTNRDESYDSGGSVRLQNFSLTDTRMFMRPRPVTINDNGLWVMKLCNVYEDGRICWGSSSASVKSLAERIDEQVKTFTSTTFNNDLGMYTPIKYNNSYTEWEKDSVDPVCYVSWPDFHNDADVSIKELNAGITGATPDLRATFDVPAPPPLFTISRAAEWFAGITIPQKRTFLLAMQRAIESEPETTPEPPLIIHTPTLDELARAARETTEPGRTPAVDFEALAREAVAATVDETTEEALR